MEKQLIISGIALLTAIANIFAVILNSRKLERIKKSLDLKSTKLQRLWEMKERISKNKVNINLNTLKLNSGNDTAETLNAYIYEHKIMFIEATDIYFINKSFFSLTDQNTISSKIELIQNIDDKIVNSIINVEQNNCDEINNILELKVQLLNESVAGYRMINSAIEKEIEKLEKEFNI